MEKVKFYCYADETGLETDGRFFLVSVVLVEQLSADEIEKALEDIERKTRKNLVKWSKSSLDVRKLFIENIARLDQLYKSIFFVRFIDNKKYLYLTALSIAKAIEAKGEENYAVKIIVDALNDRDIEKMRKQLKQLKVKYDTIRGMKNEQTPFLRLADSIAGFARDYIEGQPYAQRLFMLLKERKIISEV